MILTPDDWTAARILAIVPWQLRQYWQMTPPRTPWRSVIEEVVSAGSSRAEWLTTLQASAYNEYCRVFSVNGWNSAPETRVGGAVSADVPNQNICVLRAWASEVNGDSERRRKLVWERRDMCKYSRSQASSDRSVKNSCNRSTFCSLVSNLNSSERRHVGLIFTNDSGKRYARDVIYTSVWHARRVHDDTDWVKMATLIAVFSRLSDVDF